MAYPYGGAGQYPTRSAAYGAYWSQFAGTADQRTSPTNRLVWVVLLLGVAAYSVNYAVVSPSGIGWGVRFSTLAAVVAALGLLPRQSAHPKVMGALAITGFLEALSQSITGDQNPSWAGIVVIVLIALQALTAIAALLIQPRALGTAERGLTPYDAYAYYSQAAQQQYAAQSQQPQEQPAQAQGAAQAEAAAPAEAQQSAAERYALYAEYLDVQQSGRGRAAVSPQSDERAQTAEPALDFGMARTGSGESVRPGGDPATGSPTQSF